MRPTPLCKMFNKFEMLVGLALLVALATVVSGQDLILEGTRLTNWGDWGELELCPPGDKVYGMRLKVQPNQGDLGDDTAVNGIELLCISPGKVRPSATENISEFSSVTSRVGAHGNYGVVLECADPLFATGFQLKSEEDRGIFHGDTAANNLRLFCSNADILEGYGTGWGDWTNENRCPRGLSLCGIQTQVEDPGGLDETALNNVNMACCS